MSRLARFWREYLWRYRWWYALGVLCLVGTNLLTVAIPTFVQYAIDALSEGRGAEDALPWAWAVMGAGLGIMVVRTLSRTLFFNPGRTVEFRIKNALFDRLLSLPRSFYDRMRPGEILSRGTNDTNSVRALAGFGTLQLFNVILMLTLTLARMLAMDPGLTGLCVVPLALGALFLRWVIRRLYELVIRGQAQVAVLSDRVLESYNGVGVIQAYNAMDGIEARFDGANDELLEIGLGLARIRFWLLPVVSVVGSLCTVILLLSGGARVVAGTLTVGEFAAFTVYISVLVMGLTSLGWLVNSVQRGWVSLGRVYDILEADVARPEATERLDDPRSVGPHLQVRGLRYAHRGADTAALQDLSFEVAPGEVLGIYGATGSGKSTLLDLLARVYEPPSGTVLADGVDIRSIPIEAHWGRVAYVSQVPHLFTRKLVENIDLGRDWDDGEGAGAGTDREGLEAVIDAASLRDDLQVLPDGLDTVVGERGITLSGGQRQRVALARAMLQEFDLLLLDDVLSAVDHATEARLVDALYTRIRREGERSCTAVIVSHRISVLARADRVLVLEGGELVDSGTHRELVRRSDGPYARAWRLQRAEDAIAALDHGGGGDG